MTSLRIRRYLLVWLVLLASLGAGCVHGDLGRAAPEVWKFAYVSDTQGDYRPENEKSCINTSVLQAIARDIAEKPAFVLVGGDLVNGWHRTGGTDYKTQFLNWKAAMAPVYKAGIAVYPVRGNHESGPDRVALPPLPARMEPPPGGLAVLEQTFRESFPEAYAYIPRNGPEGEVGLTYSFVYRNALIVGLDQYGPHPHRINQDWLDGVLSANTRPHVFLYGHEPAFGVRHKDNLGFYREDRDRLWESVGKAGGKVYFCGHDHFYLRAVIEDSRGNQIRQVIAGTGGGRPAPWQDEYQEKTGVKSEYALSGRYGYVLVVIEDMLVTVMWKALNRADGIDTWQVLDSFSYVLPGMPGKEGRP